MSLEMSTEQPGAVWPLAPAAAQLLANYPPGRYTHDEVTTARDKFEASLREVHQQMGITYDKIPKVGGRELDLHMLYVNVTSLGGCERVISRKQWRDAAESFQFPPTITSVSFSLRKAYVAFLWDYEQIYYFRNTGPRIPPPVHKAKDDMDGDGEHHPPVAKKRRLVDNIATEFPGLQPGAPNALTAFAINPTAAPVDLYQSLVGSRGGVVVDARFDAGFFVTVKLGKQEFRGVLYYPPPDSTVAFVPKSEKGGSSRKKEPATPPDGDGTGMSTPSGKVPKEKDPLAPKPNKTPFNFFSVDARIKAREMNPSATQAEITKKVGEMWQRATDAEKAPYIMLSNQDKARYQAELEAYNYRLAAQAAQAQALQAAQAVAQAATSLAGNPPFSNALFAESLGGQAQEGGQQMGWGSMPAPPPRHPPTPQHNPNLW